MMIYNTTPLWARELLEEFKEIQAYIAEQEKFENEQKAYYEYVNSFRKIMRPDYDIGHFPVIHYCGRVLALSNDALLYDKRTGKTLSKFDALSVYEVLYKKHKQRMATYINEKV